ncbi:piggyBac transposable element-derived protein 4 [Trichonephila clavipes]|nr:piggyBac transposable element-derived protein 4 [Trichonephila clavipes]
MSDFERLIKENNSDIDSDSESEIFVNDSGSNESSLERERGVDRMNQHLTNYPITKKRQEIIQKNILSSFRFIIVERFRFISETGRKLSHLNFRLYIIDHLIERHGAVNEKKRMIRNFAQFLITDRRNFLEVIPPTDKKLRPTRQCLLCWSKRNDFGKQVKKKHNIFVPTAMLDYACLPVLKFITQK